MRRPATLIVAVILALTLAAGFDVRAQRADPSGPVDLVVLNGKVYPGNGGRFAEAVAVRGNRIVRVGTTAAIKNLLGGDSKIDAGLINHNLVGYDANLKPYPYDPNKAKALLAEAGYPAGFALTIHGPNNRYINDDKIAQQEKVAKGCGPRGKLELKAGVQQPAYLLP